jgi:rubrerythrin
MKNQLTPEDFQHLRTVSRKRDRLRDSENQHEKRVQKLLREHSPSTSNVRDTNNKRRNNRNRLR